VDGKRQRRKAYQLRELMMKMPPPLALLAEDDPELRRLLATALRKDGWSVIEAVDGTDLVELIGSALLFGNLRGELEPIALVISDIRMPGHSGLEVLHQLRKADISARVVLLTAHTDDTVRAEAERLGADALLPKPFEIDELCGVARQLLSSREDCDAPA
jgi:DNA-binding response OmpR family regulator